jgi:hypothetical protein
MAQGAGAIAVFCPPSLPAIRGKWEIIAQIYLNMAAGNSAAIFGALSRPFGSLIEFGS